MLLSRAFSTTCKVISAIGIAYNIGPTVTISGLQDNFKINEVCELKTKHGQCKAICTSIYEDHSEFVCFSNKSPIQLNDNVSANAFDLFNTHHNTYSIPTFNSDMQISNKFSKKKYILKKKTPTQCYSGYLGIDILQPIMEGDYVVLNGQANTGKSTVARNAIAMHLKHPNNYAVYCSTEINNCRNLMGIPTYNPSKCLVMHANLSNDSLSSYYSSFKIAESLCNDNKNVLLVLDDTAKLIKHEKEIYLPKSSINTLQIVQNAMQLSGSFNDYSLTTLVAVDQEYIPKNSYNVFSSAVQCSANRIVSFGGNNGDFPRPLPLISFPVKKETDPLIPKAIRSMQNRLADTLFSIVEMGKSRKLISFLKLDMDECDFYDYSDAKLLFPLLVDNKPLSIEEQICLAELYLTLLDKKQLVDKISNIASLKNNFLQFISNPEYKLIIDGVGTSNSVQQIMTPLLEDFLLRYAV